MTEEQVLKAIDLAGVILWWPGGGDHVAGAMALLMAVRDVREDH